MITPEAYEKKIAELEAQLADVRGNIKKPDHFYEVLPEIVSDDGGQSHLYAAFTPNNGIRVGIIGYEMDDDGEMVPDSPHWTEFDFTPDQAEMIGQALVRWAQRDRAETEMIRCSRP